MKTETLVIKTNVWVQGILKTKGCAHYKTIFLIFTLQWRLSREDRKLWERIKKKSEKKLSKESQS